MNTFLEILFSLTVAGSMITASIHALGWLSTDLFPAKWRYRLIKMAVGLYLIPIALVFPWLSQLTTSRITAGIQDTPPAQLAGFMSEPFKPAVILSANAAYIVLGVWAAGVISFAAWQLYGYRRFIKELERTRTLVPENSESAILLRSLKQQLGLNRIVGLAYSPLARSPFLAGLRKPSIYLPPENGAGLDMEMVIRHELIHLKRRDLWVKAFMLAASALHWFNPLVHTVRRELHTWSELTCDQEVVQEMSHAERKRYGGTILNVMAGSGSLPQQFYAPLSGDGKQLKRRLTHMLNAKKLKKQTILLSVTAVVLIAGISTSAAAWASKLTPQVVAGSENSPSEAADADGAAGSITQPVTVSGTEAAESAAVPAKDELTAQPAPEVVAVPAESAAAAPAKNELTAQPVPELVADPAESAPAPAKEEAATQPVSELAAVLDESATVPAKEESAAQPVPKLIADPSAHE